jgi:hypothetical protein
MPYYTYHVITPMTRVHLFPNLKEMLEKQFGFNHKIIWHILLDYDNPTTLDIETNGSDQDLIRFHRLKIQDSDQDKGHLILNKFFDDIDIKPDHRYNVLCDDDAYGDGFFESLNNHKGDVIICSMERGNTIPTGLDPKRAHPTYKLWACKENLILGGVGMEQIILAGKVLSRYRIPSQHFGDGMFIIGIAKDNPVEFAPEVTSLFNYFEPGRWNK